MKLEPKMAFAALGDESKKLWTDEKFTWQQLSSENWKARFVALIALIDVWRLDELETLSLAKSIIEKDDKDQVVCGAIQSIENERAGSYDDDLSNYFAKIIVSEEQPEIVRISAFSALNKINSPKTSFRDSATIGEALDKLKAEVYKIQNQSMNDIDWELVRSKLRPES